MLKSDIKINKTTNTNLNIDISLSKLNETNVINKDIKQI